MKSIMDWEKVILCANLCLFSYNELKDPIVKEAYQKLDLDMDTAQSINGKNASATISISKHVDKKTVYVACRGTDEIRDWVNNLNTIPIKAMLRTLPIGKVHRGMWNYYLSMAKHLNKNICRLVKQGYRRYVFTGYSLGASIIFSSIETKMLYKDIDIECYLFASPKIGNRRFMQVIESFVPRYVHFILQNDLVPDFPFMTDLIPFPKTYIINDGKKRLNSLDYVKQLFSVFLLKQPVFAKTHYISNYLIYINKLPDYTQHLMKTLILIDE